MMDTYEINLRVQLERAPHAEDYTDEEILPKAREIIENLFADEFPYFEIVSLKFAVSQSQLNASSESRMP